MIVGENAKPDDLEVNPMKIEAADQLPRSSGKDDADPPDPAAGA